MGLTADAVSALSLWAESGGRQSLLSMYPHRDLVPLVSAAGIAHYFIAVDGSGAVNDSGAVDGNGAVTDSDAVDGNGAVNDSSAVDGNGAVDGSGADRW